jgi:hypothetical protein
MFQKLIFVNILHRLQKERFIIRIDRRIFLSTVVNVILIIYWHCQQPIDLGRKQFIIKLSKYVYIVNLIQYIVIKQDDSRQYQLTVNFKYHLRF